ncbi:NtaA/DmoA family FMN-dependent monooxygenase [Novosphingobium sp. BW1]|uniref:NtaA/DmoA family FMN-dependent monooxygenase n=1 Tax=Novosphingobium sp. BW1 TaxID=2592621 RepID=UPI0011DEFAB0|nr:NtaA/DmoA family FMN-dependent monooxygenase [Novosphingobium sp. BW1]TYC86136.1 NtaA/DmoA family FMN-dependent monooxygenase [Novosphingobium sp. BW1]
MTRKLIIGMHLGNGYGASPAAWRMPGVDPMNFTSYDAKVRHAQTAERGKLHFLFFPDGPGTLGVDLDHEAPGFNLDVMMTAAAVARATTRIGMVATGSTTFNEPFNLARQFKALDIMSHGRMGWNAVTSAGEDVAANYGQRIPASADRYGRAHEMVQIVQALWGSWGKDAWLHDQQSGRFARSEEITPVNLQGEYIASRGPLYIPPSEQGQPVIFHAGGASPNALNLAGRFASAVIGAAFSIEHAQMQRQAFRGAAASFGRDPDEIKYIPGLITAIGPDTRTGLDRRIAIAGNSFEQRAPYLQQMLGVRFDLDRLDNPLNRQTLARARASQDPRAEKALRLAQEGWSPRDILAHGVIEPQPVVAGTATEVADHMQSWFEAEAADGFWIAPSLEIEGGEDFVDQVVPILQERGLFHTEYAGPTLRAHLGAPDQYGVDQRILA